MKEDRGASAKASVRSSAAAQPASREWSVDIDDLRLVLALIEREFPGWWWSGGVCSVSAHASCGPDASGKDSDLLTDRLFDNGFHADLPQPAELADALRDVFSQAMKAREKARETQADRNDSEDRTEAEGEATQEARDD